MVKSTLPTIYLSMDEPFIFTNVYKHFPVVCLQLCVGLLVRFLGDTHTFAVYKKKIDKAYKAVAAKRNNSFGAQKDSVFKD